MLTTTTARVLAPPEPDPWKRPTWLLNPDGTELMFHAVGTDIAGGTVHFELPLMFVPSEALGAHRDIRAVFDNPPAAVTNAHQIDLAGQPLAVAPPGDRAGLDRADDGLDHLRHRAAARTGPTRTPSTP